MSPLEAVILGLIQGLTEFLPISSSAHVQIAHSLLGSDQLPKPQLTAFIATIQLGTEAAVLLYFRKQIWSIAKAWSLEFPKSFNRTKRKNLSADARMGWLIALGSLPIVVLALIFQDAIENELRSLWVIAFTLIIFGLLLGVADRLGKRDRELRELNGRDGLLYGLGQALALIPGVSRSGGTISMGLALGYTREAAARYSFLLAIPAVIASGTYEFAKTYQFLATDELLATAIATLISFVVGYAVIAGLLRYLVQGSFMPFVIWRVGVGSVLLFALISGQLVA